MHRSASPRRELFRLIDHPQANCRRANHRRAVDFSQYSPNGAFHGQVRGDHHRHQRAELKRLKLTHTLTSVGLIPWLSPSGLTAAGAQGLLQAQGSDGAGHPGVVSQRAAADDVQLHRGLLGWGDGRIHSLHPISRPRHRPRRQ